MTTPIYRRWGHFAISLYRIYPGASMRLLGSAFTIILLDLFALLYLYRVLRLTFVDQASGSIPLPSILQNELINAYFLLFLLYLLKNALTYWLFKQQISLAQHISAELIDLRFSKLLFSDDDRPDSMDRVNEMSQMANHLNDRIVLPSALLIAELSMVLLISSWAIYVSPPVFLALALLIIPLTAFFIHQSRKKLESYGNTLNELYPMLYRDISLSVLAHPEISVWQNQSWLRQRFTAKLLDLFQLKKKTYLISGVLSPRILETAILAGLLIISIVLSTASPLELRSVLTLFAVIGFRLLPSVNRIVNSQNSIRSHAFLLELIVLQKESTEEESENLSIISSIQLRDLHLDRGSSSILQMVELDMQVGQCIGIRGPSGSGKSTLIEAICQLIQPAKGSILFNGQTTEESCLSARSRISLVRQSPYLMFATLKENICFGCAPDEVRLQEVIEVAELTELIDSWPDGTETILGEAGKNLSGGEAQRVAIARALYKPADVLIFDESFSELNEELRVRLADRIIRTYHDRLILLVSHDERLLQACDRILTIQNKQVHENT